MRGARWLWALALGLAACGTQAPDGVQTTRSTRRKGGAAASGTSGGAATAGDSGGPAASGNGAPDGASGFALQLRATTKIEQLLGDDDKQLGRSTSGRSQQRFGVAGADLGYSFEGDGRLILLFGDTIGTEGQVGSDAIGFTDDTDPEDGVALGFYARPDGKFLPFRPVDDRGKEHRLMGFEVPVAGIRLAGATYVAYKDEHTGDEDGSKDGAATEPTDVTKVARFDEGTGRATTLCELSRQPAGHFQKIAWHLPASDEGLPAGGPWVLMYGTGRHRASHVYLALVPQAGLASCQGLRYFTKLDGPVPAWSEHEAEAAPVFRDGDGAGTVGEVSVSWIAPLRRWLVAYDAKDGRRGIAVRHAAAPWGPWSAPIVALDAAVASAFVHDPKRRPPDGLAGPMIGKHKDDPQPAPGTLYAPFVVERWTQVEPHALRIYYTVSTWNPYVVDLVRSDFDVVP